MLLEWGRGILRCKHILKLCTSNIRELIGQRINNGLVAKLDDKTILTDGLLPPRQMCIFVLRFRCGFRSLPPSPASPKMLTTVRQRVLVWRF